MSVRVRVSSTDGVGLAIAAQAACQAFDGAVDNVQPPLWREIPLVATLRFPTEGHARRAIDYLAWAGYVAAPEAARTPARRAIH